MTSIAATSKQPLTESSPAENPASRPKVSILLITYNHEKYIAQAIESILMQKTEYSYEINVIEDCSTDRTQEIVMRYVVSHPHIVKPFFNKKNIGFKVTQKNFYRGFQTLTGDYLAILEGDDYWSSPYKLQTQVSFLEANPEFAISAHNTVKVYEDGNTPPHRFLYFGQQADATIEEAVRLRSFYHTTGLIYRNVFKGIPPKQFRNPWSCDIFIFIAHAQFGKIRHLDEDMAVYRAHEGGRFSNMLILDSWMFNLGGLRRYNEWLQYRHMDGFSEAIVRMCATVMAQAGTDGIPRLKIYQRIYCWMLIVLYGPMAYFLGLPTRIKKLGGNGRGVWNIPLLVTKDAINSFSKFVRHVTPESVKIVARRNELLIASIRQLQELISSGELFSQKGFLQLLALASQCLTTVGARLRALFQ